MSLHEHLQKYGGPVLHPKAGGTVLIAGDGKTERAAVTVGDVVNVHVGGVRRQSRVVVKERLIFFADGTIAHPHRTSLRLPYAYFAKPIQERLRERATALLAEAHRLQEWADLQP